MISANPLDPLVALSPPKSIIQSAASGDGASQSVRPSVRIQTILRIITDLYQTPTLVIKTGDYNFQFSLCFSHPNQTISWWLKDNFIDFRFLSMNLYDCIREAFIKKTIFLWQMSHWLWSPPNKKPSAFFGQKWPFQGMKIFYFNHALIC